MTYDQLVSAFVSEYGHKDTEAILVWWNDFCETNHIPSFVTKHYGTSCMCADCVKGE